MADSALRNERSTMNVIALILAIAAVLAFLAAALKAPQPWLVPLGLALFASSFIVQLVWVAHQVVAH